MINLANSNWREQLDLALEGKLVATTPNMMSPKYFDRYEGYTSFETTAGERINNLISTVITGMTDNAKVLVAKKFKLTFDQVPAFQHMISRGMPFDEAAFIVKQPILVEYQDVLTDKKRLIKRRGELEAAELTDIDYKDIAKRAARILYNKLFAHKRGDQDFEDNFEMLYLQPFTWNYTEEELAQAILENQSGAVDDAELTFRKQVYILNHYNRIVEDTQSLLDFSSLLQLVKGFKTTFAESRRPSIALNALGMEVVSKAVPDKKQDKAVVVSKSEDGRLTADVKVPYLNGAV